ncbi:MAG: patatin-like phospholipase family protein, partial [Pseudomonadota bacterium]
MAKRAARGGNGKARNQRTVNLALQGGGAHGAFTWGVLDRFLEDPTILIEGVSGTSAGAMNAVVMADGLVEGGPDGAREALYKFWREVSRASRGAPWQRTPLDMLVGNWSLDYSPGYLMMDLLGRVVSPYSLNPLNINPLLTLIDDLVDFDRVRQCTDKKLYISATNVETGRIRIFEREELTAKTVMASACLPFLYQAVEIDGEAYWDGGYMGNPALFPLFDGCQSRDIVIVQINPICRPGVPH